MRFEEEDEAHIQDAALLEKREKLIGWQSFRKQGSDAFDVQEGRSEEAPANIHCPSAFASCLAGKLQHEAFVMMISIEIIYALNRDDQIRKGLSV